MAGLIYRYEIIAYTVCACRRLRGVWKYIFVSEDVKYSGEEAIHVWQGRIRGIKKEIGKVLKKQISSEEKQNRNDAKVEQWHRENEEWKKKTEAQLKENNELLSQVLELMKEKTHEQRLNK